MCVYVRACVCACVCVFVQSMQMKAENEREKSNELRGCVEGLTVASSVHQKQAAGVSLPSRKAIGRPRICSTFHNGNH